MSKRPSRAKMCSWLSAQLSGIRTIPSNPADITRYVELAKLADRKLKHLQTIASDLAWHVDADLDCAWEQIQEYDVAFNMPAAERSGQ